MLLEIDSTVSLAFNPLTGATLLVDSRWWKELGITWLNQPLDPRQVPQDWNHLQALPEFDLLNDLGFLLTPVKHRQYLKLS